MKRIINYFKHLIYKRKELKRLNICLKVIIDAKYYQQVYGDGMCRSFENALCNNKEISTHSKKKWLYKNIPEFNSEYLANIKLSYGSYWWDVSDQESRITAFDKLIDLYKTKIKELYENKN